MVKTATKDGQHFVLAKLQPPRLQRQELVEREAVSQRLDVVTSALLTLVVAPAGYGKTTAIAQWLASQDPSKILGAWLALDDSDNDVALFSRHIIAAIEHISDSLLGGSGSDLGSNPLWSARLLVTAIEQIGRPVVLVLEDFHLVEEPGVVALIDQILALHPWNLHLVISSRTQPDLRTGRIRTNGDLLELSSNELRFTHYDARRLFALDPRSVLTQAELNRMIDRTEGWAAGLRLALLGLTSGRPRGHDSALLDRDAHAFLLEEVLSDLPPTVVDFLLETAVLDQFNSAVCDHVGGRTDSSAIIEELERRQLFIVRSTQPGWLRYHALFSEALMRILERRCPQDVGRLHRRAAEWCEQNGLPSGAIRHFLASGDLNLAADCLERQAAALLESGRGATLLRLASKLPNAIVAARPELQMERIYAHILAWQFFDAKRLLQECRAILFRQSQELEPSRIALLDRKLVHTDMQFSVLSDDMPRAANLARQWQQMDGNYSAFEDVVAQTSLIYAEREQFDCRRVATGAAMRGVLDRHGYRWGSIWHDCIIGATYAQIGELGRAESIFKEAFDTAVELTGRASPLAAMPALHLADMAYELNRIDEANRLVDEFLELAGETGLVDQLVAGYQVKARIAGLQSIPAALRVLEQGEDVAVARSFDRLHAFLVAGRIRLLCSSGELAEARRVASLHNLVARPETFAPSAGCTTADAARAFAAAQIALINNDLRGAESLLHRWAKFTETARSFRFAIRFGCALAHVQIINGDIKAAHRTLRSAIQNGQRGGFIRSFVDALATVRTQIAQIGFRAHGEEDLASYLQTILEALGGAHASGREQLVDTAEPALQLDALNDRDAQILSMASTGMNNAQIAAEVGLTVGTVKWYLQQVYGKLGVNSRSEAVFRARQLGLMS